MQTTSAPALVDEVSDMLRKSASDVFSTMVSMTAQPVALEDFRDCDETLVAGSVGFIGEVNGLVYFYVKAGFARLLASRTLGLEENELEGDDMVDDVIGELTNMLVGSVKSRLCDSGNTCVLTIPSILRGQRISAKPLRGSECRLTSFRCEDQPVLIEIIVKSAG